MTEENLEFPSWWMHRQPVVDQDEINRLAEEKAAEVEKFRSLFIEQGEQ